MQTLGVLVGIQRLTFQHSLSSITISVFVLVYLLDQLSNCPFKLLVYTTRTTTLLFVVECTFGPTALQF